MAMHRHNFKAHILFTHAEFSEYVWLGSVYLPVASNSEPSSLEGKPGGRVKPRASNSVYVTGTSRTVMGLTIRRL